MVELYKQLYAMFAGLFVSEPSYQLSIDYKDRRVYYKARSIVLFDRTVGAIYGSKYDSSRMVGEDPPLSEIYIQR